MQNEEACEFCLSHRQYTHSMWRKVWPSSQNLRLHYSVYLLKICLSALQWKSSLQWAQPLTKSKVATPIHFTRATTANMLSHIFCDTVEAFESATFDYKSKFAPHSHLGAKRKFLENYLSTLQWTNGEAQGLTKTGATFDLQLQCTWRNFAIWGVRFIFINRIRPGRTQVIQDELVNHG